MTADHRSFEAGPLLAGLGATIAVAALFVDWYEPGASAWTAFETADALLCLLALCVLAAAAAAQGSLGRGPGVPLWMPAAAYLGLTLLQIVNPPPAALDSGIEAGAWLALAAGVVMVAGGVLTLLQVTLAVEPTTGPVAAGGGPPPTAEVPRGGAPESPSGPR